MSISWGPWVAADFEAIARAGVIAGGTPAQYEVRSFFGLFKKIETGVWPRSSLKGVRMVRFLNGDPAYTAINQFYQNRTR